MRKLNAMEHAKYNILVTGLLVTGSSALIGMLKEYDNINIIPGEFDDFRAPGLVADQLRFYKNNEFCSEIERLTAFRLKAKLLYNALPIFNWKEFKIKGVQNRLKFSLTRIRHLMLLKQINKILCTNITIQDKKIFKRVDKKNRKHK